MGHVRLVTLGVLTRHFSQREYSNTPWRIQLKLQGSEHPSNISILNCTNCILDTFAIYHEDYLYKFILKILNILNFKLRVTTVLFTHSPWFIQFADISLLEETTQGIGLSHLGKHKIHAPRRECRIRCHFFPPCFNVFLLLKREVTFAKIPILLKNRSEKNLLRIKENLEYFFCSREKENWNDYLE